ncbi:MAG: hypothetical protein JWQ09_3462 [Segetibacter sp.]|nr:hypothetical protein [Segetibacter sp.]
MASTLSVCFLCCACSTRRCKNAIVTNASFFIVCDLIRNSLKLYINISNYILYCFTKYLFMKRLLIYLFLVSLSYLAKGQHPQNKMEEYLTNGKSRDWQLADYRKTLGNECKGNGQIFTFFKDGRVQVKKCVNNKIDFKSLTWSLQPINGSQNEWQIVLNQSIDVDEGNVRVIRIDLPLAEKKKRNKKMIWREFPNCKACPQQSITLLSKN